MLQTKVINDTGTRLTLKEGTAGIRRTLATFGPERSTHTIRVNTNATYREYWCAEKSDDPNAVVVSSDDCQEFKEIIIKRERKNEVDIFTWEGLRRDTGLKVEVKNGVKVQVGGADPSNSRLPKFLAGIVGIFRKG